jgi:hypothetical protein
MKMIFLGFVLFIVGLQFLIAIIGDLATIENAHRKKEGRKSIADSITFPKLFLTIAVLIFINILISLI